MLVSEALRFLCCALSKAKLSSPLETTKHRAGGALGAERRDRFSRQPFEPDPASTGVGKRRREPGARRIRRVPALCLGAAPLKEGSGHAEKAARLGHRAFTSKGAQARVFGLPRPLGKLGRRASGDAGGDAPRSGSRPW